MPQNSIKFEFRPEKFICAAAYLTAKCPSDMTKMKLFKLLFFADQQHLRSHGRPILGDVYIKMKNGPVPSEAYDMVKRHGPNTHLGRYLSVSDIHIGLKQQPDMDDLSESDVEVLDAVIQRYGRKTAIQLSDLSHREPAWHLASTNFPMNYELFLSDSDGELLEIIREEQESRELLASACV